MTKVFIDGSAGTTGLRIFERLEARTDIELIKIDPEMRKDMQARREALNSADIAFLCLPDAAAVEAVSLIDNPNTAVIDTSTAHRTKAPEWVYGFAELEGMRNKIASSKRIANPGCHASGFVSLVEPLVRSGVLDKNAFLSAFSLTGYSGGGKKMIGEYENPDGRDLLLDAPRMYGLTQQHKHLSEMQTICGLTNAPAFSPIVAPYYAGMLVSVTVFSKDTAGGANAVKAVYKEYYGENRKGLVHFDEEADETGFMSAGRFCGRDDMQISVYGNEDRIMLVSRFDNLGKGASGAAVQNMNILMGTDETAGLIF